MKMNQTNLFKETLNYILMATIALIDGLHDHKYKKRGKEYIDLILDNLKYNLLKDKKYFDFFAIADKIKKTGAERHLDDFLNKYSDLCIRGINARIVTLTPSAHLDKNTINLLEKEYHNNMDFYQNHYITHKKQPGFKIKEIFIAKGHFKDRYISEKKALKKARMVCSLIKKKGISFNQLIKKYSDIPNLKARQITTCGDIYDKFISLKRRQICEIRKEKNGYIISQLIAKNTGKLNLESNDYLRHIGHALLEKHNKNISEKLLRNFKDKDLLQELKKNYKLREWRTYIYKNPIFSRKKKTDPPPQKDLLIPIFIIPQIMNKKGRYVLKHFPEIKLIEDPVIASANKTTIKRYLLEYFTRNEWIELFELWFWLMRFRLINENENNSIKSILNISNSLSNIGKIYKAHLFSIKKRMKNLNRKYYRERLSVYLEIFLDLFFNRLCFIYDEKIERLMRKSLTNRETNGINSFRKFFNKIFTDIKNISATVNRSKENKKRMFNLKKIHRVDTHDKTYYILKSLKKRDFTLLHFDAHKDLWELSNMALNNKRSIVINRLNINEGNYLTAVIRDKLIKNLILIYPDGSKITKRAPKILKEHFIWEQFYFFPDLLNKKKAYPLFVEGNKIAITDLYNIPELKENVILDIDLDYFICNPLAIRKPWIKIEDFIRNIQKKNLKIKTIIFSYSIKDGYVSSKFKNYGDLIARNLKTLLKQ